jgi:hypothetical protein
MILAVETGSEVRQAPTSQGIRHFGIGGLEDGIEIRGLPEASSVEADSGVQIS